MALQRCTELSPAGWIVDSDLAWDRLVTFGPAGFEAYARLRFIKDPEYPGQSENDAEVPEGSSDRQTLAALLERLAVRTATPDDCYFCVWDGWGGFDDRAGGEPAADSIFASVAPDPDAVPGRLTRRSRRKVDEGPKVTVPHRSYYLFRGSLADLGDAAGQRGFFEPAFIWPNDHRWCVAKDVDPHWAGIGADHATVDALVADPAIDVVPADPTAQQPFYS